MRRLAVAATALVVAAGWLVVTAPTGRAAGALTTAWWWQGEPSRGAVPGPPTVPDGGLWVSSNATGPQAVSAVRVPLDAGDTAPVLTLTVHQAAPSGQVDDAARARRQLAHELVPVGAEADELDELVHLPGRLGLALDRRRQGEGGGDRVADLEMPFEGDRDVLGDGHRREDARVLE